ncbi:phage tail assembly protein T [Psychrobacter glaciei]|uniref:phage tail assembly protein T n=1 Tax=Psychrobacter glaciei TaxID=619771 RepID=UPI001F059E82|nr:hypothetical protein [Psychrobacter glaciei]MCH1781734.1 hypothetical protein [Psychrobacter glaciei]
MSAHELIEWQAFYLYVEPFGGKFLDMQFASLRKQNYGGDDKRSIEDFMLYDFSLLSPEQKEQERLSTAKLKAQTQAAELRGFFASKANKSTAHN